MPKASSSCRQDMAASRRSRAGGADHRQLETQYKAFGETVTEVRGGLVLIYGSQLQSSLGEIV